MVFAEDITSAVDLISIHNTIAMDCISEHSDVEEIEIPTVILPYQFEPLASAMPSSSKTTSDSDGSSSYIESDVDEIDLAATDISTW